MCCDRERTTTKCRIELTRFTLFADIPIHCFISIHEPKSNSDTLNSIHSIVGFGPSIGFKWINIFIFQRCCLPHRKRWARHRLHHHFNVDFLTTCKSQTHNNRRCSQWIIVLPPHQPKQKSPRKPKAMKTEKTLRRLNYYVFEQIQKRNEEKKNEILSSTAFQNRNAVGITFGRKCRRRDGAIVAWKCEME